MINMISDLWITYFRCLDENEEPMDVQIFACDESDIQSIVCDMTFEEMYEDFCVEINAGFSVEEALRDKTAVSRDDYGYRWHYAPVKNYHFN